MRIYRKRLTDESGIPLEVVHPTGEVTPAKYASRGITIAQVQGIAQRADCLGDPLTWYVREAEDDGHTVVARIVRQTDGIVSTTIDV